jgi:zinc transport system substrate-binding protein
MKKRWAVLLFLLLFLPVCAACRKNAGEGKGDKKPQVVTTLFPLYDFARTIAGDRATVSLLLPPGVEPHSFEPKPEDMVRVGKADLFVYTDRYMEPWAAELVKGVGNRDLLVVDAGKGAHFLPAAEDDDHGGEHGHHRGEGMDPHIWLDLDNAQKMVDNIAAGLAARDQAGREYYLARAAAYKERLAALDRRFKSELMECRDRLFLHGGHYAFGYLAARYGLRYVAAYALSANAEPTPKKMAALVRLMKEKGLKFIFYEELLSPTMADTLAREGGARLLKLHGIHNVGREELEHGATFISLMEQNLANLKVGLQCR